MKDNRYNGFAIALAWPETFCKQAGAWYDFFMGKIGFSINNQYKVGHAAVVLVDGQNGKCHYFDFGRYHAPFGHGRVRDEISDPDLCIRTRAIIRESKTIENLNTILGELYYNPSCHGTGSIYASYTKIDFEKAYRYAKGMQDKNPWKYGPFTWNGTNCSRFVRSVILSGDPAKYLSMKLRIPLSISPTPVGNVKSLGRQMIFDPIDDRKNTKGSRKTSLPTVPLNVKDTLSAPIQPASLPEKVQWLAGEGAGSWFHIEKEKDLYRIYRYSPDGRMECSGNFKIMNLLRLDLNISYEFVHISDCDQIKIKQEGVYIILKNINENSGNDKKRLRDKSLLALDSKDLKYAS